MAAIVDFGFDKVQGVYGAAEVILACQELCPMELVS
jgi:hypothetical protein